jgi:hypothetical protein
VTPLLVALVANMRADYRASIGPVTYPLIREMCASINCDPSVTQCYYSALQYIRRLGICFGGQNENTYKSGSSAWNDCKPKMHVHISFYEGTVCKD